MLRDFEGVIAAETGHIALHEAGAIEATGHKVITLPHQNGKINATELDAKIKAFYADDSFNHMVFPGMVYISHPTEYGTLYSKEELTAISNVCHTYNIPLYMDGARLGYGLASYRTDVTLRDIARLTDAFYIGGTKVGALCGEAVVFKKDALPRAFFTKIKQHGALLAKGRLLGIQFDTLFTDDLYMTISRHAIEMAEKLKNIFINMGYEFFIDSPTNQIFVIIENDIYDKLFDKVRFCYWENLGSDKTVVRFATSWATTVEDLEKLENILKEFS